MYIIIRNRRNWSLQLIFMTYIIIKISWSRKEIHLQLITNWIIFQTSQHPREIHLSLMIEKFNAGREIHLPLMIMFQDMIQLSYSRQGNTSAAKSSGNNYFIIFWLKVNIFNYLVAQVSNLMHKIQTLIRQWNIQRKWN